MLLLSTSSLKGYGLHKIFQIAKKSNYDGIDLDVEKGNYDTFDASYVKSLSDEFKVPVLSITSPDRGLDRQKIDEIIKMAGVLNSQVVNFSPAHITDKNMDWYLGYLSKVKTENRLSITLQNVEQKFMYFVIPEYKNSNILDIKKVTGDTALNVSSIDKSTGMDLNKMLGILGSSIKNIYICDKQGTKDGLMPGEAGGGLSHLPLESFFMKLKNSGYNGFFSLKVKPAEMGVGNEEKIEYNLESFKKYYKKHYLDFKE